MLGQHWKQAGGEKQLGTKWNHSQTRRAWHSSRWEPGRRDGTSRASMGHSNTFLLLNTLNQSISSFLSKGKAGIVSCHALPHAENCFVTPNSSRSVISPIIFVVKSCSSEQTKTSSGHQPFLSSSEQTSQNSSQVCSLAMRK